MIKLFGSPPPRAHTHTHTHTLKCYVVWDFPGSSMVRTLHSLLRAWVQFLVKELRSSSHAVWPKKKKKCCIPSRSYLFVRYIYQMLAKVLPPPSFIDQIYYFGGTQVSSAVYLVFAIICNCCNRLVNF